MKLLEFFLFIKTLNLRLKEKDVKTIETEESSQIIEEKDSLLKNNAEISFTEKFLEKLKGNDISNISKDESSLKPIIKDYEITQIKLAKNFKSAYGSEKEKNSDIIARELRNKKLIIKANKELDDSYDIQFINNNFKEDIISFNRENGKEGIYKDINKITSIK